MTTQMQPNPTTPQPGAPEGQPGEGIPQNPQDEPRDPSTTEQLFPDFIGEDGQVHDVPVDPSVAPRLEPDRWNEGNPAGQRPPEGTPAQPTPPAPEGQPPATPPEGQPQPNQYLDIQDLSGKMFKAKVGGVEIDVPAESLVKNYQLESHLQSRLQEVAQKEKTLLEIQQDLLRGKQPAQDGSPDPGAASPEPGQESQLPKALQDELKSLRTELAVLRPAAQKVRYQSSLERIDARIQQELGRNDFKAYIPKIEAEIRAQLRDPNNPTPEEVQKFDNELFYVNAYQRMVLRDLQSKPNFSPQPTPPQPGGRTFESAPAPMSGQSFRRPAPQVTPVEAGGGSPSAVPYDQRVRSWERRYQTAMQKAVQSGSDADWDAVIRIKSEAV